MNTEYGQRRALALKEDLRFDDHRCEIKTCELDGRQITYRAFEGLAYCTRPVDPIQTLNLYVPEAYYQGATINGYDLHTAPIFAHNTAGGYAPGEPGTPGRDYRHQINAVFAALEHGYVVACSGVRGRCSGKKNQNYFGGGLANEVLAEGEKMVGKAPALIVDMKAAIRYLRHNQALIPGNTDRIITNGTSSGGALSALAGATGNSADYNAYLREIGAADERDDVFAVSAYCPIHNLENADAAYEWQFCGCDDYHSYRLEIEDGRVVDLIPQNGRMSEKQIALAPQLKTLFSEYVNSLHLTAEDGRPLTLAADGEGSFKDYVKQQVLASIQKELDTHYTARNMSWLVESCSDIEKLSCITIEDGLAVALDWDGFVQTITRQKTTPAFDHLDLSSVENDVFGTETLSARHFTEFSHQHSEVGGELAESAIIRRINPVQYIGVADTAKHWRIRHGAFDRDTSLAIPVILATLLKNKGYDVDFELPWGLPHSGDYDLPELFAWIDRHVNESNADQS